MDANISVFFPNKATTTTIILDDYLHQYACLWKQTLKYFYIYIDVCVDEIYSWKQRSNRRSKWPSICRRILLIARVFSSLFFKFSSRRTSNIKRRLYFGILCEQYSNNFLSKKLFSFESIVHQTFCINELKIFVFEYQCLIESDFPSKWFKSFSFWIWKRLA